MILSTFKSLLSKRALIFFKLFFGRERNVMCKLRWSPNIFKGIFSCFVLSKIKFEFSICNIEFFSWFFITELLASFKI